jgi:hypothetical protein
MYIFYESIFQNISIYMIYTFPKTVNLSYS